jgi:hypothetical protein
VQTASRALTSCHAIFDAKIPRVFETCAIRCRSWAQFAPAVDRGRLGLAYVFSLAPLINSPSPPPSPISHNQPRNPQNRQTSARPSDATGNSPQSPHPRQTSAASHTSARCSDATGNSPQSPYPRPKPFRHCCICIRAKDTPSESSLPPNSKNCAVRGYAEVPPTSPTVNLVSPRRRPRVTHPPSTHHRDCLDCMSTSALVNIFDLILPVHTQPLHLI